MSRSKIQPQRTTELNSNRNSYGILSAVKAVRNKSQVQLNQQQNASVK